MYWDGYFFVFEYHLEVINYTTFHQESKKNHNFAIKSVSREQSAVCRVVVRNFRRDGSRPTAYGVQALFANHFMLL